MVSLYSFPLPINLVDINKGMVEILTTSSYTELLTVEQQQQQKKKKKKKKPFPDCCLGGNRDSLKSLIKYSFSF